MIINVAITGNSFSGFYVDSITHLIVNAMSNNIKTNFIISNGPDLTHAKNYSMKGKDENGMYQLPFTDKYDYVLMLDNTVLFNFESIMKLVDSKKDIIAPLYHKTNVNYNCGIIKNNQYIPLTDELLKKDDEVIQEVDYVGLSCLLIKQGIIENLNYPWFYNKIETDGEQVKYLADYLNFSKDLKDAGYKIFVNKEVKMGSEKNKVIGYAE